MSKRTHKFKALSDIQGVVNAASSLGAAAKKLGVDRSTLYRWVESGKIQAPQLKTGPAAGAGANQTPEAWAAEVRAMGELDATRNALLCLAEDALRFARDATVQPMTRLAAMGRYQQLVKQLCLASESTVVVAPRPAAKPTRRADAADPRAFLMAMK